ncbi:hypothetical protein AVEN_204056-1 [Araneus ventricosus]|uniref:Uncharacterized protein n=1 Tax=Araneus ventricosus TaxID=182803 RepID=A0A4Y2TTM8_ARAVE|nr:hypothetical protein AVEN_204056-1 [Araneus ventricosus]
MVCVFDKTGTFTMKPRRGCELTGMQTAEEIATALDWIGYWAQKDVSGYAASEIVTAVVEQSATNAHDSGSANAVSRGLGILYSIVSCVIF